MRIVSLIILLSIVIQSSGRLAILINFKIHQEYIALVLCEKKDVPNNSCKGNCQLTKQLNQQQETEKQLPPDVNLKEFVLYHSKSIYSTQDSPFRKYRTTQFVFRESTLVAGYISDVFHPPAGLILA
jgi:hypothetical protein